MANLLSLEKHNVVVIDRQAAAFDLLDAGFNGATLLGNGIDVDVQRRAGVEKASAFIAVSGSDATNLMAAQVARRLFNTGVVVARIYDIENKKLYERFGIKTVSPTMVTAMQIRNFVAGGGFRRYLVLEGDGLEIVRASIRTNLAGKTVKSLNSPGRLVVHIILRDERAFIPTSDTVLTEGDSLIFTVASDFIDRCKKWFELER